jgi:alanine racemase
MMNTMPISTPSPRAIVDCAVFRKNLSAVRAYVGPDVRIMAVIKANAYGHGVMQLAREADAAGVRDFGVARVQEGFELREAGFLQRILVFEAAQASDLPEALEAGLALTVATSASLEAIEAAARACQTRATVHVKMDTGMGRLGLAPENAVALAVAVGRSRWAALDGVYSHFATSEDPDPTFARHQLHRFFDALEGLTRAGIEVPLRHMANSGAIISMPDAYMDMVRPGIMLYGYPPRQGMAERHPVEPVLSLVSRVAFLKSVESGVSISYGRRYVTDRRTTIATVPMGYGDGYSRLLTGKASVLIRGEKHPVVGTVCMDQLMIDLGPESPVTEGDEVAFIGQNGSQRITAWDVAALTGTIPYETTCVLTSRVPRSYAGCT